MNEEDCEQDRATQVGGGDAEKERGQDVRGCAREKVCTLIHATEAATNDDEDFLKSALCMVHHLVMAFYSLSLSLARALSLSLSLSLPPSLVCISCSMSRQCTKRNRDFHRSPRAPIRRRPLPVSALTTTYACVFVCASVWFLSPPPPPPLFLYRSFLSSSLSPSLTHFLQIQHLCWNVALWTLLPNKALSLARSLFLSLALSLSLSLSLLLSLSCSLSRSPSLSRARTLSLFLGLAG